MNRAGNTAIETIDRSEAPERTGRTGLRKRGLRKRGLCRRAVSVAMAGMVVHLSATLCQAQKVAFPPDDAKPIGQWVCVLLFAGFVVALAAKNPKRSHKS